MEMKLALAQYPIKQHQSFASWTAYVESWVKDAVDRGAKILVFPEYGSMELTSLLGAESQTDLLTQLEELQALLPDFLATFQQLAIKYACIIIAPSFPVKLEEKFVNRAYVLSARQCSHQDKHFMTRFEDEQWGISSSDGVLRVFKTEFGNFGVQLCFDIEFAIGGQLLAQAGAELVVVPSCTETIKGATRVHIGARARAMEQQIYVGVSQTIENALWSPAVDVNYGYSALYASPDGNFNDEGIESIQPAQTRGWLITTLDTEKNKCLREDGQVLNYKWSTSIQMDAKLQCEVVEL